MKANLYMKGRGPSRVSVHQVVFELKHKVVIALNKLADRDTYQLGVDELDKLAQSLNPDGINPFLSCILDIESEQKSAVRKECIRLLGTMVRYHEELMGSHLGKMISSIVKRLKDPDSVVRDACVETVEVFASKLSNSRDEAEGVFIVLVRPLFEALGEQNKQIQSGAAFCLARIIDNIQDPPVSIMQNILARTIKLLKNPRFMAKPAIIELNRSIIQAGGARTQNILSAAMTSLQESLKNSDWTTRKAASVALGEIASSSGSFLGSFKASSICSLESCRFDKVKPVRDSVLHALQCWRTLPRPNSPELSEAASSIKENFCGDDYSDLTSASGSGWKDVSLKKVGISAMKSRIPFSIRRKCQNNVENPHHSKEDDWNVEIALPKTQNIASAELHGEESEDSCVSKTLERSTDGASIMQDIGFDYVHMDDKQECSSLVTENCDTRTVSQDGLEGADLLKPKERNQRYASENTDNEEQMYSNKIQDRRSLNSTVTESGSPTSNGCCLQIANEMVCIRKQLMQIESKQSNLMDALQVFTSEIMNSLSKLQSKVVYLENVVDSLAEDLVHRGGCSSSAASKITKPNHTQRSPRLSTCTPRPSIDIHCGQPSPLSVRSTDIWVANKINRSSENNPAKRGTDIWTDTKVKITRNPMERNTEKDSRPETQKMACGQFRKGSVFGSGSIADVRQIGKESKNNVRKRVKDFLSDGDLDSAYIEAICSVDDLVLVELLDRTGPVLECLSSKTVCGILNTLASYLVEQRFINTILPWLQQLTDLSANHGPSYLVLSAKSRQKFLCAVQESANMEFFNPSERRSITQIAVKLHHIWGNCS